MIVLRVLLGFGLTVEWAINTVIPIFKGKGAMPEIGTTDAVFILRRLQEEYHAKVKKLCMCFVDLENALDRVPRNVL